VIVAIHGTAFGGGLELAMAGHYRVAVNGAQVGQPEAKLGLIPGAGGTQRLPRLAGVAKAVEMCAGGNPTKAEEALKLGIVDRIIEGDLLAGAVAFAREVANKPAPKTRVRNEKLGGAMENALIFSSAREAATKKQRGLPAPVAATDAVEAATKLSFEEGCKVEQSFFWTAFFRAIQVLNPRFFSEREVSKIPYIPKETAVIPIKSAAVVGAGTMGGGIAMVLANAGIPALIKDTDQAPLDRGLATIRSNYENSVKRGRFSQKVAEERLKRITPTLSYDDFSKVDLAIEAIFEGMALKKEVFRELVRIPSPARRNLEARPATATTCRAGQDFRGFWQGRRSGGVGILRLD
jgi:3-hydroxyacyl-CoA dehydrogenase